ncbi:MAG: protein kinase domain-containing protein [Verrucomicrobiales bacterium]
MNEHSICIDCGDPLPVNHSGDRCDRCLIQMVEAASAARRTLSESAWEANILCDLRKLRTDEERSIFLSMACAEDDGLQSRLKAKIGEEMPPGYPTMLSPGRTDAGEAELDNVGPYKIRQKLGKGGFGVVYMAEQETPVRRRVALKVIKPGLDDQQVIARFEAERQALAMMDHPNIARVFDAGATEKGRPYFVMELVRGVPITDYCDQNKVPPRQRLELFLHVCRAVQHAHQKGIIHRDIKPSNVLVTLDGGNPVPKVIDFGIAKAIEQRLTDKTLFTRMEQLIGTPAYMSPEQAEMSSLDVDTRSDIYSLGVLLYELLTGTTPLEKETLHQAGFDHMRKMIREFEPPRPSLRMQTMGARAAEVAKQRGEETGGLTRLLRGDLDWIVMKALEKDRTRRYETANGLATDIQRHLNNEPVLAGPPSAAYRIRKFIRRNRVIVTAGALVVLFLVAGLTASIVGMGLALKEKKQATAAKSEAEKHARNAQETLAEKKKLLTDMFTMSGLAAVEKGDESNAIVWFAGAARETPPDSPEALASLARLRSCASRLPAPERALKTMFRPDILQFHPNGKYLMIRAFPHISKKTPNPSIIWDTEDDRVVPAGDAAQATAGVWNSDGAEFLVAHPDGKAEILTFPSLIRKEEFALPGAAYSVAFSPDSQYVAAGGDNFVVIRDRPHGHLYTWRDKLDGQRVTSLEFGPDNKILIAGLAHERAQVLSVPSAPDQSINLLFGAVPHRNPRPPLYRSMFGLQMLFTQASEHSLHVFNIVSGQLIKEFGIKNIHYFTIGAGRQDLWAGVFPKAVAWSGLELISEGSKASEPVSTLDHRNHVNMIDFLHDPPRILTASSDGTARIWEEPGSGSPRSISVPHYTDVISCSASPSAGYFATGQADGLVRVWHTNGPDRPVRIPSEGSADARVVVSRDGRLLSIAGATGMGRRVRTTARVYAVQGGTALSQPLSAPGVINGAAFSMDGSEIVLVGSAVSVHPGAQRSNFAQSPGFVVGWDWESGRRSFEAVKTTSEPVDAAWHPKIPLLAVACAGGELMFLSKVAGSMEKVEKPKSVDYAVYTAQPRRWVRFSPSGRFLVQIGRENMAFWNSAEKELLWTKEFGANVLDFAFSPNEESIAVALGDGGPDVLICDASTGHQVGPSLHHSDWVFSVDFDPEGRWLLTGSRDRTVRLWDLESRKPTQHFECHDEAMDAKFFGGGNWIIAAVRDGSSTDGVVRIWSAHSSFDLVPEIAMDGFLPRWVEITANDRFAIISGRMRSSHIIDLAPFDSANLRRFEPSQMSEAELMAGKHLRGSVLLKLGTEEWLGKWKARNSQSLHRAFRRR